MLNADSKELQALLESFTKAEQRVQSVLLKTDADTVSELKIEMNKQLDRVSLSLTEDSKRWANKDLPEAYKEGVQKINGKTDKTLHQSDDTILNSYIELSTKVQSATENARNIINGAIREAEKSKYGATVGNVKDIIQDTLSKENASMYVEYSNGTKMPLDAYASMLARTSRIESSNTGAFDRCNKLGIDLVRCTTMSGCCAYCKMYEGKVYSISGNDKRFPALYETALQRGYNIMHPNCRHEFIPFVEEMQSATELKNLIEKSNHFEKPSKDDAVMKKYLKDQATLRQWRSELNEYNKLKAKLGNDMPYSSLGAFRRGKRVNSALYQKLHKQLLDSNDKVLTIKRDRVKILSEKRVEFSADKFPISFGIKKKEVESFKILSNFVNKQSKIDNNVASLYTNIPKFDVFNKLGIPFKVKHTKDSALQLKTTYDGRLTEVSLDIPIIEQESSLGAINTNLHEIMHYIDRCTGIDTQSINSFSAKRKDLLAIIKDDNGEIGNDTEKIFTDFNQQVCELKKERREKAIIEHQKLKDNYTKIGLYDPQRNIFSGRSADYSRFKREWKAIDNKLVQEYDEKQRSLMGGGISALQDIYDALSGGKHLRTGKVLYGHGVNYFTTSERKASEIVANYGALSITRPDLIDILRKDKPKLVLELEKMVKDMLKGVE